LLFEACEPFLHASHFNPKTADEDDWNGKAGNDHHHGHAEIDRRI
jgi:hypothetical protein